MSTRKINNPPVPPTPTPSKTIPLPPWTLSTGGSVTIADYTKEREIKMAHGQAGAGVDSPLSGTREDARVIVKGFQGIEGKSLMKKFAMFTKKKKKDKDADDGAQEDRMEGIEGEDVGLPMRKKE